MIREHPEKYTLNLVYDRLTVGKTKKAFLLISMESAFCNVKDLPIHQTSISSRN